MTTLADAIATPAGTAINPSLGRQAAATTRSLNLSNEDFALLTALSGAAGAVSDTPWASGNGTLVALLKAIAAAAVDTTTDSPVAVHQPCDVVSFTPTLDTSAYAANDVLFATAAISVSRANDLQAMLSSLTVIDKSKQKPAFSIFFYQANVTSAAANAANNLSDADAINCLGFVSVAAAAYKDLANNSFACLSGATAPNLLIKPATGTTNVYAVGILDAGTPTFAAGDLVLKLGVVQR